MLSMWTVFTLEWNFFVGQTFHLAYQLIFKPCHKILAAYIRNRAIFHLPFPPSSTSQKFNKKQDLRYVATSQRWNIFNSVSVSVRLSANKCIYCGQWYQYKSGQLVLLLNRLYAYSRNRAIFHLMLIWQSLRRANLIECKMWVPL